MSKHTRTHSHTHTHTHTDFPSIQLGFSLGDMQPSSSPDRRVIYGPRSCLTHTHTHTHTDTHTCTLSDTHTLKQIHNHIRLLCRTKLSCLHVPHSDSTRARLCFLWMQRAAVGKEAATAPDAKVRRKQGDEETGRSTFHHRAPAELLQQGRASQP